MWKNFFFIFYFIFLVNSEEEITQELINNVFRYGTLDSGILKKFIIAQRTVKLGDESYRKLQTFHKNKLVSFFEPTFVLPTMDRNLTTEILNEAFPYMDHQYVTLKNYIFNNPTAKVAQLEQFEIENTRIPIEIKLEYFEVERRTIPIEKKQIIAIIDNPLFYRGLFQYGLNIQTLGKTNVYENPIRLSYFSEKSAEELKKLKPCIAQSIILENCHKIINVLLGTNLKAPKTVHYFYLAFLMELYHFGNEEQKKCAIASIQLMLDTCPVFIPKRIGGIQENGQQPNQRDLVLYEIYLHYGKPKQETLLKGLNIIDPLYLTILLENLNPAKDLQIWGMIEHLYDNYLYFVVNLLTHKNEDKYRLYFSILLKMFRGDECNLNHIDCNDKQYPWLFIGNSLNLYATIEDFEKCTTPEMLAKESLNPLNMMGHLIECNMISTVILAVAIRTKISYFNEKQKPIKVMAGRCIV